MPRVGDVVAQVPTLSTSGPSTPVTPRPVTRHSSAQLQIVSPPILRRSQSAGIESESLKTPRSIQSTHREQSIRQHRSSAETCHQNSSDDAQRSSRKSSTASSPKKSPSRRRTVVRSLAGLEITIELQQALLPSKWFQKKSQLWYKAYALTSQNEWTEKVSQPVAIAGTKVSPLTLHMSLSCDEAKDFLKNEDDYKPIELRVYNGVQFLGSIPLPMHTTESSWFFSIEDSPFEVCAYITLEGSTMHDLDAGSVLENIPTSCYWHCNLPISAIAITKKHGLVQWDECLGDSSYTNKSGSLERQSTLLRCNLKNLPASIAALFFIVVNDSSEPVTCRLEERIGLGRMKVPASRITLLGRITFESNGFEMMTLMKSFPIISDLGALIPVLHMCARDVIQDPVCVPRTAWMRPNTCIQLLDYCPRLTSLVVDIRCKKGDVMALFLDERGQRVDVVDQHHMKSRDRSVTMTRKMIELELHRVGMRVQTIAFITTAEFSCHVWDPATEAQLIRFTDCPIDPCCGYKHILVGCLNRSDESFWDFWAVGSPTKSNSLHALCDYVHNLHPSPKPSSLFPIEPFDVPAKSYLDSSDGIISADQLLKAMKVSQ
jgi:stress response protein SCP2